MTTTPRAATRSIVLLTVLFCSTVAAFGADHFVSPAGSGAACSQSVPCSLAAALAAAQDGDRVYVGAGTYVGAGPDVAVVSRGIEVLGGWNGVGSGQPLRDPIAYESVLDGQGARRCMRVDGDGAVIDGLTVTNGDATGLTDGCGGTAAGCGGGILVTGDGVRIANSTVRGNVASSAPDLGPQVIAHGGGIKGFAADDLAIEGCTISGNVAHTGNAGRGGGIEVTGCDRAVIARNRISGNAATTYAGDHGWGGGISFDSADTLVADNVLTGNRAHPTLSDQGNAIYSWYGTGSVRGNEVTSDSKGSAVLLGYFIGDFTGNRVIAGADGQALETFNAGSLEAIEVTNNVLAGGAGSQEVVLLRGHPEYPANVTLRHNTVVGPGDGSGVHALSAVAVTMSNTIVASVTVPLETTDGGGIAADHTLFWDVPDGTAGGPAAVVGDPRFANRAAGDYRIMPGSAAIGAGADAGVMRDIDGEARPGAGGVDIGADELAPRRFDFGTPSSPVDPDLTQVTHATAFTPERGYGWAGGTIASRDRGGPDVVKRDFCFTQAGTFAVTIRNGRYLVTVAMGDAAAGHGQMAVFLEGVKVAVINTAGNEFTVRTFDTVVADGALTVLLDDEGGSDPNVVINELTIVPVSPLRLDFGTAGSPLAAGWTRATHAGAYSAATGFGWLGGTVGSRDRGIADPLLRDLAFTPRGAFAALLPDGVYDVTLTLGDAAVAHDQMGISLQGSALTAAASGKNQFATRAARTGVADGRLDLLLDDQGGSDANVVVNGVEVAPPPPPLFDFGTASSPVENGFVRVTEKTAWADGRGYGWIAGTVTSRDRGTGSALGRDLVFSKDATFAVDVRPGRYEVTVTIGDAAAAHDEVEVAVGDDAGDTVTVAAGQLATRTFEIEVSEPPLLVRIVDGGGVDVNAVINALEIR